MKKLSALLAAATLLASPAFGSSKDKRDDRKYQVVINHEEQYSIWFADRNIPDGWDEAGFQGSKQECLDYIEEVWTDMRPLSFRKHEGWSDDRRYQVVINHEEQYSIWFADRELPDGWKDAGFSGSKQECLDYIEEVWTDMRPLSFRKRWDEGR